MCLSFFLLPLSDASFSFFLLRIEFYLNFTSVRGSLMLWLSSADALLIAAQTLFCLLPLISLLVRRAGVPAPVHTTQLLAMSASLLAFALLVAMFILLEKPVSLYLQDQWRGALFTAAAHFPTTFAHRCCGARDSPSRARLPWRAVSSSKATSGSRTAQGGCDSSRPERTRMLT